MGIITKKYDSKYDKPIALALGYFDAVHIGHKLLIDKCKNTRFTPAIFTFSNSPYQMINGDIRQVFTFDERLIRLERLGVEVCLYSTFDASMMNRSGEEFLDTLTKNNDIKMVAIGADYTCGKDATMKAECVKRYFEDKNIACEVVPLLSGSEGKISSSCIRRMLMAGDVESINAILPMPYSVIGVVVGGRAEGKKVLGFPTANLAIDSTKLALCEGVYHTLITVDNIAYHAITNVGNHPTFHDFNFNIESFILDFHGDLYQRTIEVVFLARLRDTRKFENFEELSLQIASDERRVREWIK